MDDRNNLNQKLIHAKTANETAHWLAAGADVNASDIRGRTALMFAETPEQKKLLSNAMKIVHTETKATESFIKSITTKLVQKLR